MLELVILADTFIIVLIHLFTFGLASVAAHGLSLAAMCGLLMGGAPHMAEQGSRSTRLGSCEAGA